MKQTDSLGRSTFHHIAPLCGVRPTAREVRWLKHIERHGPQSSQYLHELTRDTHRCKDTSLRQIQKLRAGGFLRLPHQQRSIERAEFNPYIYDLTQRAENYLYNSDLAEPTIRPTGHWWHAYTVSCVTSSINIAANRAGVRFIPTHEILAINDADLAVPIGRHGRLIPDQLFALDYGGCFRSFALEVDRGTEPRTSPSQRKSWRRSIEQYYRLLDEKLHSAHYGLSANLIVLFWFTDKRNEDIFHQMLGRNGGSASKAILTSHGTDLGPDAVLKRVTGSWARCDGDPVNIIEKN